MNAGDRRLLGLTLGCWLMATVARAELRIEQPLVQLGEIKGGLKLQHRLALVNSGNQPLELLEVKASCGCLVPRFDKRRLGPGEKASVVLEIRPLGQADGAHAWNGLFRYRQGDETKATPFTIRATIRNEVTIQPTVLAMFVEGTVRQEVTVTDRRKPPFKVIQARASCAALRVETKTLDNGVTKIVLRADGQALKSGREETLLSIVTNDPVYSDFQIPVTLVKTGGSGISATPEKIVFRLTSGQKEATALVRLRGRGTLAVDKVETSHPAFTATWAADPEAGAVLRVRFTDHAGSVPGGTGHIRVHFSRPMDGGLTIPIIVHRE